MQHQLSITEPGAEEHQATQRLAALKRARQGKARADAMRRAEIIREELARPRAEPCACPITPHSTPAQLRAMGAGCTAGRWVCPTLDAIRRRLGG